MTLTWGGSNLVPDIQGVVLLHITYSPPVVMKMASVPLSPAADTVVGLSSPRTDGLSMGLTHVHLMS